MQASLPLEMLRSWNFLNHGEERITPILRHPEQGPVNSSLRNITLCHPELVSGSSHRKTLEITQNKVIATSTMGQMLKRVQHDKKKKAAFTLAEGATHVDQSAKPRRAAFTLAEVLITLGIIGVVAALTLPTLISNYQKQVYVNQLKKSVSVLSNGFKLMMAHDGVTELKDTEAYSEMGTTCSQDNILTDNCRSIREGLQSVFSGIQFTPCDGSEVKFLNGRIWSEAKSSSRTCMKFSDGSEIFDYYFYKNFTDQGSNNLSIDINGSKKPNTVGRDIFILDLLNTRGVYGFGSSFSAELNAGGVPEGDIYEGFYWRTTRDRTYKCDTSSMGVSCTGRVLEEDAMNY